MNKLLNLKKAPREIAQLLAQDSAICALLTNDTMDALNDTAEWDVNTLISEHYIWFYPPVETGIKDFNRNTFLTILLDTVSFGEANSRATIVIYIGTANDLIMLNKNRNRLLELSDLIVDCLDKQKLSSMGQLSILSMSAVEYSTNRSGYRISFSLSDQQNERSF